MNKGYWSYYYDKYQSPTDPSDFAQFVNSIIKTNSKIIDIGCGNGRDTQFFEQNDHNVVGVDNIEVPNFLGKNLIKCDATNLNVFGDVYYCRFFLHTLSESDCDVFLKRMSLIIGDGRIFIETRSSDTNSRKKVKFKSPIGENHYRMLYSIDYLDFKFSKYFKVEFISESTEFAVYENEKPLVIRSILKKK